MARKFIVYDEDGTILRWGICATGTVETKTQNADETAIEVDELTDNFDIIHKVVDDKVVFRSSAEILARTPPGVVEKNPEDLPANISHKDLAALLDRLANLEAAIHP